MDNNRIHVKITYGKTVSIDVNGRPMQDIDYIEDKPIPKWFAASNDSYDWKGLLNEICNFITEDSTAFLFEFEGSEEDRQVFQAALSENTKDWDVSFNDKGQFDERVVEDYAQRAENARAKGNLKEELDYLIDAANHAKTAESQYKVAVRYMESYHGENPIEELSATEALEHGLSYYRMAADQGLLEAQWELFGLLQEYPYCKQDEYEEIKWLRRAAEQGKNVAQYELGRYYFIEKKYDTAVDWLTHASESDLSDEQKKEAYYLLGRCYSEQSCYYFDNEKANTFYEKAARKGHIESQNIVGCLRFEDSNTSADKQETFEFLRKAGMANNTNAKAQYYTGCCYAIGYGTNIDKVNAVYYYSKAADNNYTLAQYQLGLCYAQGIGVQEDKISAFKYFEKAANGKYPEAQCKLGDCYWFGNGIDQDKSKAIECYLLAAENNHAEAQAKLSSCYYSGDGTEKNLESAFKWSEKAAKNGDALGQRILGNCYHYGVGVEKDVYTAVALYKTAVSNNNSMAMYFLGKCYEMGEGVAEDPEEAFKLYQKSALAGLALSEYELGRCYSNGYGVIQDHNLAFDYYEKAADQGLADAQYELGKCYLTGKGRCSVNEKKAFEWYEKAAEQGFTEAQYRLGWCYDFGKGTPKKHKKAVELYWAAAAKGCVDAVFFLAQCYELGKGVKKSSDKALELYTEYLKYSSDRGGVVHYKIAEILYSCAESGTTPTAAALAGVAMLVPVTNWITIPAAALINFGTSKMKIKKFLNSESGQQMLECYRKAAELGHADAAKKLKKFQKQEKVL